MHDSCESLDVSVCHTIRNMTSPSICQFHDLSVYEPKHDLTWYSICPSVCLLSVLSIQPSAKFTVKTPMSIAGQYFPKSNSWENSLPSVHHQIHLLVHQEVCQSLSPSAENLSKFPGNNGEKNAVITWMKSH